MYDNERVTLQYSIAIEELPEEVARLIRKASQLQSEQLSRRFKKLAISEPYEFLSPETLSNIQQLRYVLSSIDVTLGDVENIIDGFFSMQEHKKDEAQSDSLKDGKPVVIKTVDELSEGPDLVDQLRLFKEKVALQDDQEPSQNPDE